MLATFLISFPLIISDNNAEVKQLEPVTYEQMTQLSEDEVVEQNGQYYKVTKRR